MVHRRTTPAIFRRAQELRRERTPAEVKLWAYLRSLREEGLHFRQQHAIGPYIVDFCASRKKLIIEVDGSQHLEQAAYDARRTAYFEARGYRVMRVRNPDVMNDIGDVMEAIQRMIHRTGAIIAPIQSR